jgi:acetyltransferase-like isoleucine patch superfamily enzyme
MKNPLAHIKPEAPLHLFRSLLFHISSHVERRSVSKRYFGLCAYLNGFSSLTFEKGARVIFDHEGFLTLGTDRSSFRGWSRRSSMFIRENAILEIQGFNQIGRGTLVWILEGGKITMEGNSFMAGENIIVAKESVRIGKDCAIAWGVTICDHDFHKLYVNDEVQVETAPVVIEDNVWIGMNATILKGVTIGRGAVVGAGAVVTKNVAARTVVAGNPARVIRENVDFRG